MESGFLSMFSGYSGIMIFCGVCLVSCVVCAIKYNWSDWYSKGAWFCIFVMAVFSWLEYGKPIDYVDSKVDELIERSVESYTDTSQVDLTVDEREQIKDELRSEILEELRYELSIEVSSN